MILQYNIAKAKVIVVTIKEILTQDLELITRVQKVNNIAFMKGIEKL